MFGLAALLFGACADEPVATPQGLCGPGQGCEDAGPADSSAATDVGSAAHPRAPQRVLFVGNSYTQFGDLPGVLRALAAHNGYPVVTESVLVAGATLGDHWLTTGARQKLEGGAFGAVVLQGQSLEALSQPEAFLSYASKFAAAAKSAGTQPVWFATWARGPRSGMPGAVGEAAANRIEQTYSDAARSGGGVVARVGGAFHQTQVVLPEIDLYDPDQSHPSAAGTWVAACTIAHALFGSELRVPTPPPLGLAEGMATRLCQLAGNVRCLEGGDLCGGTCFRLQTDPRHCGTCTRSCATGEPCSAGLCGCTGGQTACGGVCRSLSVDTNHCGACGKTCATGETCRNGACACVPFAQVPMTFARLAAMDPSCVASEPSTCADAAEKACVARGCSASGFGPSSGHAPANDTLMCLPQAPEVVAYSSLQALDPACAQASDQASQACASAVHRHCQGQGAVSGFANFRAASVRVTCLAAPVFARPGATLVTVGEADLQAYASRCTPHPVSCNAAAWNLCVSFGFQGGFGPVEVAGAQRTVACIK